jgi:RNA polymerase sigma-70 factor (ECF subfamily)
MLQVETFNEYRPLLFSIAYRMLGSAMDAEDMVQEAFLRWQRAPEQEVNSPKAYLSTVVTRLCLDQLKSARAQREVYVGPWLPEPILTSAQMPGLTDRAELADSLSLAFLTLLESLSPVERAVFLLHEVFEYDYAEISQIVDKSEANCRQMVRRAKQHLQEHRPRYPVAPGQRERLLNRFLQATSSGDMDGLLKLLTEDIVVKSDGGGKASAMRNPLYGKDKAARFIFGLLNKARKVSGYHVRIAEVNGAPAMLHYLHNQLITVMSFDFTDDQICGIYSVVNPDKLQTVLSELGQLPDKPIISTTEDTAEHSGD